MRIFSVSNPFFIFILIAVGGFSVYGLSKMDIEYMIQFSSPDENDSSFANRVTRLYMFNFRGTEKDIRILQNGSGLDYILNGDGAVKYQIAKYFLSKGLDINGVNNSVDYDLTPLHAAVLYNEPERVIFLLEHGANKNIRSSASKLTPLEYAHSLQKKIQLKTTIR